MRDTITLIIHIGSPKTGTSAIQGFLNYNRQLLAKKNGILYPNFNNEDLATGLLHNHSRYFSNVIKNNDIEGCIKILDKTQNYCRKNNISTIVLSNEGFFNNKWPSLFKEIFSSFDIEIKFIVYLRRQDHYIESAWKQWGHKSPEHNSIQTFVEEANMNWYNVLEYWLKYFSPHQFIVRPYEKTVIGENIVTDFLNLIGIMDISDFVNPPPNNMNLNQGFNRDIVEILKLCNKNLNNHNDNKLIDFMHKTIPNEYHKKPYQSYYLLSPKEKIEIIKKYEESNIQIANKFLKSNSISFFRTSSSFSRTCCSKSETVLIIFSATLRLVDLMIICE
jgi:hypothetical protein